MALAVGVRHVRLVLTRHVEPVRRAPVARGDDHRTRLGRTLGSATHGAHGERAGPTVDAHHGLVLPNGNREMADDGAIVGERVTPRRLVPRRHERDPAQRELLGRGEEGRVRGVMRDRADDTLGIEHERGQPGSLRGNRRGETAWAGSYDDDVNAHLTTRVNGCELAGQLGAGGLLAEAPSWRLLRAAASWLENRCGPA